MVCVPIFAVNLVLEEGLFRKEFWELYGQTLAGSLSFYMPSFGCKAYTAYVYTRIRRQSCMHIDICVFICFLFMYMHAGDSGIVFSRRASCASDVWRTTLAQTWPAGLLRRHFELW